MYSPKPGLVLSLGFFDVFWSESCIFPTEEEFKEVAIVRSDVRCID